MSNILPLDMPAAYWREKAQHASRTGNYPEAVRLFRAALRKHADNAIRRELAATYADMHAFAAAERLYLENLAHDPADSDSIYGLARSHSLAGNERLMAEMLDTYLRAAPCGTQADHAREILWRLPRDKKEMPRMRRAQVLRDHAADHMDEPERAMKTAQKSWQRGKTAACAQLLCELYLRCGNAQKALQFAYEASRMQPDELRVRLQLAQALYAAQLPNACHSSLEQAAKLCKTYEQTQIFCQIAMSLDCADIAQHLMEERVEQHPYSIEYLALLALALYAQGKDQARARELLLRAQMLDEDDHMARAMLEMPWNAQAKTADEMAAQSVQFFEKLAELANVGEDTPENLHKQLVNMMRLPMPGTSEMAARMFIKTRDAVGMRLALLQDDLSEKMYAMVLDMLRIMGEKLPCYVNLGDKLYLMPQCPPSSYDADLHQLVRELLHRNREHVALDVVVRQVPQLWYRLPESARRHFAQSGDEVWPTAFSAYLYWQAGDPMAAKALMRRAACPRRIRRAYMQLIRRSDEIHEVY